MANEKWNLETNSALTAEPGSPVGLANPPRSAEQHVTDRAADYGKQILPPKPQWFLDKSANPQSRGATEPRKVQLFWRSNVGQKNPDPTVAYKGVAGLGSIGVAGHRITVVGQGDIIRPGSETQAVITGWWDRTDPVRPVWKQLQPATAYTFTVEAYNQARDYGPASDPLTVTTPALGYDQQQVTYSPKPPNDLDFAGPLPLITSAAGGGIQLRWTKIPGVTKYEIFDNSTAATNEGMDSARPGLNAHDTKLGEVNQPATGPVTFTTPNYSVPRQAFSLKVRAVRTDANGTAYSAFSPALRGHVPAALNSPGKPAAPALFETPVVGGLVKLTINPPAVGPVNGPPEWYAVYDGNRKIAVVNAPLGAAPHVTRQYAAGQTYSFTVVAGNDQGVSTPSTALTGTV